jgi:hypothetical protein
MLKKLLACRGKLYFTDFVARDRAVNYSSERSCCCSGIDLKEPWGPLSIEWLLLLLAIALLTTIKNL